MPYVSLQPSVFPTAINPVSGVPLNHLVEEQPIFQEYIPAEIHPPVIIYEPYPNPLQVLSDSSLVVPDIHRNEYIPSVVILEPHPVIIHEHSIMHDLAHETIPVLIQEAPRMVPDCRQIMIQEYAPVVLMEPQQNLDIRTRPHINEQQQQQD